ncbi:MAG TPA: hypothetical protein VLE70_19465 [Anaerolineae bacterium]|jgi:hypothetical protein|nr:hypothetical protein [Anaerolineae bacterium]
MTPSIFKRYSLAFKKHVVAEYEAVEVFQGLGREADPAILASADDQRLGPFLVFFAGLILPVRRMTTQHFLQVTACGFKVAIPSTSAR